MEESTRERLETKIANYGPPFNKLAFELQERLVGECIKFATEKQITIDMVGFSVDCMDESIKVGEWKPSTDSSIDISYRDKDGYPCVGHSM